MREDRPGKSGRVANENGHVISWYSISRSEYAISCCYYCCWMHTQVSMSGAVNVSPLYRLHPQNSSYRHIDAFCTSSTPIPRTYNRTTTAGPSSSVPSIADLQHPSSLSQSTRACRR